jgi:hypothetical protein
MASASVWERLTAADVALAVVNQLKRPGSVTADQLANGILRSVDPTLVTSAAVLTCILRYGQYVSWKAAAAPICWVANVAMHVYASLPGRRRSACAASRRLPLRRRRLVRGRYRAPASPGHCSRRRYCSGTAVSTACSTSPPTTHSRCLVDCHRCLAII